MEQPEAINVEEVEFMEFKVKKEFLEEGFRLIATLTKLNDLENAISMAKLLVFDERERDMLDILSALYKAECSGMLKPPISLKKYYGKIFSEIVK